jgi:CDP-paratose 2-epimerase
MKYLITGGCGFLGSNIAEYLLKKGYQVIIYDNLSREGSTENLEYLESLSRNLSIYIQDIQDYSALERVIKVNQPNVVFHFAAQVAMTKSISDPLADFKTNALGTINLLELIRIHCPDTIVCFSSTNKVYGDLKDLDYSEDLSRYQINGKIKSFDENTKLDFHSPYGCSKGSADQYMLDYNRIFGLKTIVFRHSSIYGGRQFATIDQGWVGWFIKQALRVTINEIDAIEISGNGKQVRDVLYSTDLIDCYMKAIEKINVTSGNVYNIGGGYDNSLSILELFHFLECKLNIKINKKINPFRKSDQKIFIADISKAKKDFNWEPNISKEVGLNNMIDWEISIRKKK